MAGVDGRQNAEGSITKKKPTAAPVVCVFALEPKRFRVEHLKLMNRFLWLAVLFLFSLVVGAEEPGPVFVVPLKTEVSEAQFFFLRRALKNAEMQHASAFVIDMETYGGDVKAAIDNMEALLRTTVPTYTFVNPRAISAGALIAVATQKIYMAPGSVIGAAAPVAGDGGDLSKTMKDKVVASLSAMARSAAQKNAHNAEVAEAFIDKKKEVKIGDIVINRSDSLLALSAEEAVHVYNGRPLLADGIAMNIEGMLRQAGLNGPILRVAPSGAERLAVWITKLAPLLLLGGVLGAYLEFKIPGFGLAGIASLICFGLFFTGHYIAGLAGWETIVLFVLGLILVLGELIIHPGTVLPGLLGVLLMLGAMINAMIDRWPSQGYWPTEGMLMRPLFNVSLAMVLAIIAVYVLAKFLPRTSLYQRLVLSAAVPAGPVALLPRDGLSLEIGAIGITHTTLRPSGKACFGEHLLDVVSSGDFIEAQVPVKILMIEGARVVVERA